MMLTISSASEILGRQEMELRMIPRRFKQSLIKSECFFFLSAKISNRRFSQFASCKVIFLDAGFYVVSSTLTIPAGTRLVGEAWPVIAGKGIAFQDQLNPQVVVRVGEKSSQYQQVTEITDVVFTTVGPAAGAIIVEWNVRQPYGVQAGAGMWDAHIR